MTEITITTNRVPRDVIYGDELSPVEREEHDYLGDDIDTAAFFRYKGSVFYIGDFMRVPDSLDGWDGYQSDTYFSGIVVKYVDHGDRVIVGRYYS